MTFQSIASIAAGMLLFAACSNHSTDADHRAEATDTVAGTKLNTADTLKYSDEIHLSNVRQLTFGGDNAEAYWSFGNDKLVFQSNFADWGVSCDQIFIYDFANPIERGTIPTPVSTGLGRTTCSYFVGGDTAFVYASTHEGSEQCPPEPSKADGYVWPIYPDYDIYLAKTNGEIIRKLTDYEGYDAEATVSPDGKTIVFTSMRSGDLELYTMDLEGGNVVQITQDLGYDGGAFFSPDGKQLVWRSSRPQTAEEKEKYLELLNRGLVMPSNMELYVGNVDGTDIRKVTDLGGANWAPFFHPSGEKIIFSSNHESERGFPFNLYMINVDGTGLEQITHDGTFDAFPMFSPDGKKLVFSSNRFNGGTRATNLFVADWVE